MKDWLKFLHKQDSHSRQRLDQVVIKLLEKDFDGLDVKELQGSHNLYRCRIGSYRIIFSYGNNGNLQVENIGNRGDIYKQI